MPAARKKLKPTGPKWVMIVHDYSLLLIGCTIIALAFNGFLFPNQIASGGVSGISTIVSHLMPISPGYVQWAINIPLFLLGLWLLGRKFGLKTLVGTLFFPFAVIMTSWLDPVTSDPMLAALFGGKVTGLGLGMVFRGRASTGGTSLAAQIIHKYTGLTPGSSLLLIDGLIVSASAIVFHIELGLYAALAVFVTSRTIDIVQMGIGYAKVAFIISDRQDEVQHALLHDLDRGVTRLLGKGGYSGEDREVLLCVVQQTELTRLKELIRDIDPYAFVVVSNANEVLGEGFRGELYL